MNGSNLAKRIIALAAAGFVVLVISSTIAASRSPFVLRSKSFAKGGTIALQQVYGEAGGRNISPELNWSGAPVGTKSFAVVLYDTDVRGGFWHWFQTDIPPSVRELPRGSGDVPQGALIEANGLLGNPQLKNSFGDLGYSGPCPPPGDKPHHYIFTLCAVNVRYLPVKYGNSASTIAKIIQSHTIGTAALTGTYGR
jgi:Raf kinase inhibitor-like YbhB/YbcL family protein